MNTLAKLVLSLMATASIAVFTGCTFLSPNEATLPTLAEVQSRIDTGIANDLSDALLVAKQSPRIAQRIQTASVEVGQMSAVVVVVASRLPPIEHFADVGVVGARGTVGL